MNERVRVAAWFFCCGLLGWATTALLYFGAPLLSLLSFAAAGGLAGLRLSAGPRVIVGSAVTFLIGNIGAYLPIMATQAMSEGASRLSFLVSAVGTLAASYGLASLVGFVLLVRSNLLAYGHIVGGFVAGGVVGGVLLALSFTLGSFVLGVLAIGTPVAVGGFVAAGAVDPVRVPPAPRWHVDLARWQSLAVLFVVGVTVAGAAYRSYWSRRTVAEARWAVARTDPRMLTDDAALYNGLAKLSTTGDGGLSPAHREALEVYLVVRYRSRIEGERPLVVTEFQTLAVELAARHAAKTDQDLLAASQLLGPSFLDDLNRPYPPR